MRRTPFLITASALLALVLSPGAHAQPRVDFGGELRATFGAAFDGSLPVASACLRLGASGEVGAGLFPDAAFEADLRGCYDAATGAAEVRLGKAFATLYLDEIDLIVGQQIVAWGSVDLLSPVDVVNPRDLRFPVARPEDQRLPVPMVRAVVHSPEDVTLDLVLVPAFTPSILPDARWQAGTSPALVPPAGLTIVGQAPTDDQRPAVELANVQYGVRVTFGLDLLDGADVSATYFRGIRPTPTASARLVPTTTPGQFLLQPVLGYDRTHVVGLDFSAAASRVVVRGEVAYTATDDPGGTDPAIGNPGYNAVLGGEVTFLGGALLGVQALVEHVAGDSVAGGVPADTHVSALATVHYEPDARLTAEAAWLHDLSDGSGMVRPMLSYTFADGVKGTADLTVFYGRDGSRYGSWRDNGQLRLSLAYSF